MHLDHARLGPVQLGESENPRVGRLRGRGRPDDQREGVDTGEGAHHVLRRQHLDQLGSSDESRACARSDEA